MGVVYLARHAALGRRVALKMVLAGGHARADELVRFLQEAAAAAKLQHPNVVQVYEVGQFDGRPFFTLECVEGGSLARYAKDPLPPRDAAVIVEQVARGVAHAHANGIAHRDLKPDNVLMADGPIPRSGSSTGGDPARSRGPLAGLTPKITDFGLAKTLEAGEGLTATGAVMGTPIYMAPEQARGDTSGIGPAADVWALGAILYRLLTGRPPFAAENTFETLCQVIGADPVPPS
jgi:serine/threonine-protein kinase